ncbi:MAG TPA: transporter substrate-binding protein [Gemmataceae bacterium]|nr:transporter substrate-binding protein [Gemmataceae bacterium]
MKPTPTETHCLPLKDLRRLLQPELPEAEAAPLREHLHTCLDCRQRWLNLQAETVASATPPILRPAGDTNHGQAAPASASAIVWSSEIIMEGSAGQRPPDQPPPSTPSKRKFPFLSSPREEGELGWLAHYRISGVLGEGGMGFVFDAFDTHLHRRVALKVLKPDLAANLSFRERFLLEARVAAALPDEYIITIYQVGLENDVPFLAMKFLYGESLEQRVQRDGRLPVNEILRIGREIALGLSAAHDHGLIHRDIKPANLWLETPPPEQGTPNRPPLSFEQLYRVKILDFGLARPINDSRRLTATGLIVGTPQYLAPEQARGQPLDHRCDLFSLGIVLYRLATGILPFDGSDTLAQLTALAVAQPRPIEELSPEVPAGLCQLIHQLLARDPANRPLTARAVAEALRALEKDEMPTAPLSVGRASQPDLQKGRAGKPDLRKGRRWLLGAGLMGLLLGCGLLLWDRHRPAEAENAAAGASKETIKVGVLFSLRGSMERGGTASRDAAHLAVEELNKQGGLLGRIVEAIDGDGASDYRTFAAEAEKLITEDRVSAIFGTRASVNRKAVKEVVEKHDSLLFYPMQFEGLEDSPNIIYLGAAPNQQIFPAIEYMLGKKGKRRLFLVGSDYVFPHTANAILRDYVKRKFPDAEILGENYIRIGSTEIQETIRAIKEKKPDLIVNTINGDTNTAFFRALYDAGIRADTTPVLSFSMGENDLRGIVEEGVGHYAAWSYFQSIDREENRAFVRKFQNRFDKRRDVSDPMETVYFGVHLWAQAVQAAGSFEPRAVRESIKGRLLEAPEGSVRIDKDTLYTWRPMRIGRVMPNGQFQIIEETGWALPPEPFPFTRTRAEWEQFLNDLYTRWGNRWLAPDGKQ